MIVLRDKYEGIFLHSFSQDDLKLIQEQLPVEFNKYFEDK